MNQILTKVVEKTNIKKELTTILQSKIDEIDRLYKNDLKYLKKDEEKRLQVLKNENIIKNNMLKVNTDVKNKKLHDIVKSLENDKIDMTNCHNYNLIKNKQEIDAKYINIINELKLKGVKQNNTNKLNISQLTEKHSKEIENTKIKFNEEKLNTELYNKKLNNLRIVYRESTRKSETVKINIKKEHEKEIQEIQHIMDVKDIELHNMRINDKNNKSDKNAFIKKSLEFKNKIKGLEKDILNMRRENICIQTEADKVKLSVLHIRDLKNRHQTDLQKIKLSYESEKRELIENMKKEKIMLGGEVFELKAKLNDNSVIIKIQQDFQFLAKKKELIIFDLQEKLSKQDKEYNTLKNNIYKDVTSTTQKIKEEYDDKLKNNIEKNNKILVDDRKLILQ